MVSIDPFIQNTTTRQITEQKGEFAVLEYNKTTGFAAADPERAFYLSKMGIRKKQVMIQLNNTECQLQAGAMQMMLGNIQASTGVQGVGGLVASMFSARATGETAIKPRYGGQGFVILEPTWKFILLEDLSAWGGSMTTDDGMFLACSGGIQVGTAMRQSVSAAVAGGEGLFSPMFTGQGIVALESPLPRDELIEIELNNDTVKIDGNNAVAWTSTLQFTVERVTRTLIGSAASGEGLVNTYRGTGKILMAP